MMSTWHNTQSNFTGDWTLNLAPSFTVAPGTGDEMIVTPHHVRGLLDGVAHAAIFDASHGKIFIVFELRSAGVASGNKLLGFASPAENHVELTAEGPAGNESNWATDLDAFDGTWAFSPASKIVIRGGHVQCIGVAGIKDGVYQAVYENAMLVITFALANKGYVGDDPSGHKLIDFIFPHPQVVFDVPTESERYEETGSGGGF